MMGLTLDNSFTEDSKRHLVPTDRGNGVGDLFIFSCLCTLSSHFMLLYCYFASSEQLFRLTGEECEKQKFVSLFLSPL